MYSADEFESDEDGPEINVSAPLDKYVVSLGGSKFENVSLHDTSRFGVSSKSKASEEDEFFEQFEEEQPE